MADFEDHAGTAASIALEIERKMVALNIDWHDEAAMKRLASDALCYDKDKKFPGLQASQQGELARMELCGLIALMHQTIAEGAEDGLAVHGNEAWKALARALWAEKSA